MSNIKFVMNGRIIVKTMHKAIIEIRNEICKNNKFSLALLTSETDIARQDVKYGTYVVHEDRLSELKNQIPKQHSLRPGIGQSDHEPTKAIQKLLLGNARLHFIHGCVGLRRHGV